LGLNACCAGIECNHLELCSEMTGRRGRALHLMARNPVEYRASGTEARRKAEATPGTLAQITRVATRIAAEIPRLRRYALALIRRQIDAEELVQDCLARALSRTHLWEDGTDLRAWLFAILHNQYVNKVRRAAREGTTVMMDEEEPLLARVATQGGGLELRDLHRALGQISEKQRAVVLLVGLEGMSYQAIADLLDVPVGTVRSRLSRGRAALRHLMGFVDEPVDDRAARSGAPAMPRPHSVGGPLGIRQLLKVENASEDIFNHRLSEPSSAQSVCSEAAARIAVVARGPRQLIT
jgi:RNA polymerase sigma-70 factor (ECF subfamily)